MTVDGGLEELVLLLVDDDAVFRAVMARALRSRGLRVFEASGYKDALVVLRVSAPRYAVVDVRMGVHPASTCSGRSERCGLAPSS